MQIQFHPGSGRGAVRTISVGPAGERAAAIAAGTLALLAVSMWLTVPAVAARFARRDDPSILAAEARAARDEAERVKRAASLLLARANDRADFVSRIAFLYRIPASVWPRLLGPERRATPAGTPERIADGLPAFLRALERGRSLLAARETDDPGAARENPAILPLGDALFEPSAYFGPRRSPWTNEDEFLLGVEIAAPEGAAVVAPADGSVTFTGTVRRGPAGDLWQLGNVVVLSHGSRGATVFGHLGRVDVRPGEKVRRGTRLGAVGSSGWTLSPQLHYEYWRPDGSALRPTDPLFAVLDLQLERRPYSLEQMEATWAPGPASALPGIGMSAEAAIGPKAAPARKGRRRRL